MKLQLHSAKGLSPGIALYYSALKASTYDDLCLFLPLWAYFYRMEKKVCKSAVFLFSFNTAQAYRT